MLWENMRHGIQDNLIDAAEDRFILSRAVSLTNIVPSQYDYYYQDKEHDLGRSSRCQRGDVAVFMIECFQNNYDSSTLYTRDCIARELSYLDCQ